MAVAIARPDKPQRGYNYQAPARSFSPRQTYQAPESIEDTYAAPSSPEVSYSSPESSEEYGVMQDLMKINHSHLAHVRILYDSLCNIFIHNLVSFH